MLAHSAGGDGGGGEGAGGGGEGDRGGGNCQAAGQSIRTPWEGLGALLSPSASSCFVPALMPFLLLPRGNDSLPSTVTLTVMPVFWPVPCTVGAGLVREH